MTGVDISAPLLARAEARRAELGLDGVGFILADAQAHPFAPQGFDLVASRFGMMFFADPVAAFANMRRGLRPGGRIVFAAWAGPERNPWFTLPLRIAEARLGPGAPSDPDGPGPMAFRDLARVRGLLAAAGFAAADAALAQTELHHPGGVARSSTSPSDVGPTARLLREKNRGPTPTAGPSPTGSPPSSSRSAAPTASGSRPGSSCSRPARPDARPGAARAA